MTHSLDDGELNTRVRNWMIERSGIPLEARAASIGWDDGWWVTENYPYVDSEGGTLREIDLVLGHDPLSDEARPPHEFSPRDEPGDGHPFVEAVVECCRTPSHPWVFFQAPEYLDSGMSTIHHSMFWADSYSLHSPCFEDDYWTRRVSKNWDVAFSKSDSEIFDALVKATKGTIAEVNEFSGPSWVLPIVVIDGPLFTATIDRKGALQVTDSSRVSVLMSHNFVGFPRSTIVEVVALDHLASLLQDFRRLAGAWWEHAIEYAEAQNAANEQPD
ncbi:MAG: hypothetical protein AB7I38_02890 [Dehalococcoidia bacterium]